MLGNGRKDAEGNVSVTVLLKVCTNTAELRPCTPHGNERAPLKRKQELNTGKGIKPETDAHDSGEAFLRQILVQEKQIVAERSEQKIYLNEINTVPGFMAYHLWLKSQIPYGVVIDNLIQEF